MIYTGGLFLGGARTWFVAKFDIVFHFRGDITITPIK